MIARTSKQQIGVVYLELAIVLPVMLLLMLAAIESGRAFSMNDQASFAARVVGATVSRACTSGAILSAFDDSPSDPIPLQACLQDELQNTWDEVSPVLDNIRLIASIYRKENGTVSLLSARAIRSATGGGSEFYDAIGGSSHRSKYSATAVENTFDAIDNTGTLAIVEAYVLFQPVTPFVDLFFGGSSGQEQYVVTIY